MRVVEHFWIELPDGGRLAARAWLPEDAEQRPVPALLEYIPYRKRDLTRDRDALNHPFLAGHGYACIRIDLRGSGESSGVLKDEYLEQEQQDAVDAIAWIASQPWGDGNVDMFGISWGGFNALQVAARRPPALKAIISACATHDLYHDNMHYMGGCLLGDNLSEATVMLVFNSLPPDPALVGEQWREMWLERLQGSGLWIEQWLRHQRRSEYWHGGSVAENYSAIQCPVLSISGWNDGYTNAVFRLLENLEVPRRALIGPWNHKYPHEGVPGPAIGFLHESLRWWDHWLKGVETGIMAEPMVRAWMQDSVPPTTSYAVRPGRWVGEPSWPSSNIGWRELGLAEHRLCGDGEDALDTALYVQSPLTVGLFAGKWCSYAATPDLPHDQRQEDGGALTFDSRPLTAPLELLGGPELELEFSVSEPVAMIAAQLSDVLPDGKATRVSYGLLNLNHVNGHERPEQLEPGRRYRATVAMNSLAQAFPAGHRLRLSLSTSHWPLAWPSSRPVRLTVHTAGSRLRLPERPPREDDQHLRPFEPAAGAPPLVITPLAPGESNWCVIRDMAADRSTLQVINDQGAWRIEDIDLELRSSTHEWYSSVADDFTSPRAETRTVRGLRRGSWSTEVTTRTVLTCDGERFHVYAELDARENDRRVWSQNWNFSVERDHV